MNTQQKKKIDDIGDMGGWSEDGWVWNFKEEDLFIMGRFFFSSDFYEYWFTLRLKIQDVCVEIEMWKFWSLYF